VAKRKAKTEIKRHAQEAVNAPELPRYDMLGELMFSNPWLTRANRAQVFNPMLLLKSKGIGELFRMRKDEQVKAALKFKKLVALSSGYCVKHAEGLEEDPIADFVWKVLDELPGRFEVALREMLSALDFGFSVTEKVYSMDGAKAVLKALKTRHPGDIVFEMDAYGNVLGLRQLSGDQRKGDKGLLPTGKFAIYTHDGEFGNPYGISDLEAAYLAYFQKDNALIWMSQLLERYGVPPAIIKYRGYNTQQMNALNDILDRMASSTVIALPMADKEDSVQIDFPEVASQVQNTFIPALTYADQRIAKALLMPGLMGLTSDTSEGSYARAQVHFDAFMLVVESLRSDLRNVIQEQVVNQLCELNFPERPEGWPQFDFEPIGDEMKLEFLTQWAALAGAGIVTKQPEDEEHIRRQMKMPELVEREPEAPAPSPFNPAPPASPPDPNAGGPQPEADASPARDVVPPVAPSAPLAIDAGTPVNDDPDTDDLAQEAEAVQFSRPLAECERQVDFASIVSGLGNLEGRAVGVMASQYARSKEALAKLIRDDFADGQLDTVQSITALPGVDNTMPSTVAASLRSAFGFGRAQTQQELGAQLTLARGAVRLAEVMGKTIDLRPSETMAEEAQRGLDWRRKFGRGGTEVGIARARDLVNRAELSPDTVKRMVSFFARHEVDKQAEGFSPGEDGYPSNGRIAWALWGGDAGKSWAEAKAAQIDRIEKQAHETAGKIATYATEPNYIPEEALRYLEAKAIEVADITNARVLGNVKLALLNGVKQGQSVEEVIEALDIAFDGYTSTNPAKLETIVRTNFTDAFNQGRLVQSRQAEDDGVTLLGYMFSAITDSRSTEVCLFLDRKIFKASDPDVDRLTPPRHFNCRSVLVTLTPATGTVGGSFITDAEKAQAFSLSASGFTHDCSEHKTGAHEHDTGENT